MAVEDDEICQPATPGRPPSPKRGFTEAEDAIVPAPVPPRECASVPSSFPKRESASMRSSITTNLRVKLQSSSLPTSALPSRNGSPAWRRPASSWSRLTTKRSELPMLYMGKDEPNLMALGQYGPGSYDVRCSKMGSPLARAKGTPRFGSGERFDRSKCYEGKENTAQALGRYGPGMYDVRPPMIKGTPRFGSGERFDRAKAYEGKENAHLKMGQYGPGMYDVRPPVIKGTPRFAGSERFDRAKAYEGKENSASKFGQFGPAFYDVRCSKTGSPLWKGGRSMALPRRSPPKARIAGQ